MIKYDENLLNLLESEIFESSSFIEILKIFPDLTSTEAYEIRQQIVSRRLLLGDSLVGYKVAGSNINVRKQEHVEGPIVGCILNSRVFHAHSPISLQSNNLAIEAEVGILLKHNLKGPGVTLLDAYYATETIFPAFEILVPLHKNTKPSHQSRIIASNFRGAFVFGGSPVLPHGIDLRLEGMSLFINDTPMVSSTGVEVLGNPMNALPLVANTLSTIGQELKAGMIVMTGSIAPNIYVKAGDKVEAVFSSIGGISINFASLT